MEIVKLTVGMVQTNCYIAYDEKTKKGFVVDPGADAVRIVDTLQKRGVKAGYIILTHAHFDHVLAVNELRDKTGAQVVVCRAEEPLLTDPELAGYRAFMIADFQPIHADILVDDGGTLDAAGTTLTFLHTPGHTPGGMCILAGDVMFSGDTLFAGTCGRCDLPGGDYSTMLKSLARLAQLPGDYRVYPGHEASTTLEAERAGNPYMREGQNR